MDRSSIAVVIPAFNSQEFICDALDSAADQERRPDQLIVIDDGSTDETAAHVKKWSDERGIHVDLIVQENGGPAAARNAGIRHASTDLIALLDSDDLILAPHLALLESALMGYPDIVLCFGDAQISRLDGPGVDSLLQDKSIEGLRYVESDNSLRVIQDSAFSSLLSGSYIPSSANLIRREAALDIGLFDENESMKAVEDQDFFLRLSRVGRFAYYPMPLCQKREHRGNLTHPRNRFGQMRNKLHVLLTMRDRSDQLDLSDVELSRTNKSIEDHCWEFLYQSSERGWRIYVETFFYLMGQRLFTPLFNLKHLLRALRSSVSPSSESSVS